MDAVELPLPAAVAVSRLMGSEGFGGVGVTSEEVAARKSDRFSLLVSPSNDTCGSRISQRDEAVNASEPTFRSKISNVERGTQLPSFHSEGPSKDLNTESTSNSLLSVPMPEAKQSIKKSGKVARSSSGSSKRSRVAQSEVSINEAGDINGKSKELGLCDAKYNNAERTQLAKQKNNSNGKRGDKRNGKIPKSKTDSFSLKAGLVSFSSAAGGNNILGLYGLKPDINDVTKQLDEPLLNELLDGSYKCPSIAKDKGKKTANLNENIMHSVREACSILRLRKPVQPHDFAGVDNNYDRKVPAYHVSSDSSVTPCRNDGDRGGDTYGADLHSSNKVQDSCNKQKTTANILDCTLYRPKVILERLALPPPKDLEFLLMDTKPASASKNNPDLRLGKPVSHRGGLQPFSWSQSSGGHCKSNSDSVKLSTSRNTCQGRWVKIGNPASFLVPTTGFLVELESLNYDHHLVPSGAKRFGPKENEDGPPSSVNPHSSATCSIASRSPPAEHCAKLLAAAQTLYDIATHPLKQNSQEIRRWPKKPSQKSMRACNYKSNEKPEEVFAVPKPKAKPDSLVDCEYHTIPSKKLKLSVHNGHIQTDDSLLKGPINWSTARSSRSSPNKFLRDSVTETRHHNASTTVKKSCMMPPPARVLDKASNNQPKVRKLAPMDWNRAGGKLD